MGRIGRLRWLLPLLVLLLLTTGAAAPTASVPTTPPPLSYAPQPEEGWSLPSLTSDTPLFLDATPTPPLRTLVVGYYAEDWEGDPRALNSLRSAGTTIDRVVNFQLTMGADGAVTTETYPELLAEAKALGAPVYGLVHNWSGENFDASAADTMLSSPERRHRAVEQLLSTAAANGLAGIDVDLENVGAAQRSNYTAFIQELSGRLKPAGYGLTISVPAKVWDDPTGAWVGAYDYAVLGRLVDQVAIMAYDEHYPGSAAGPVASLDWVDRVAAYAVSQIEPSKILLGIAAYGYDWPVGSRWPRGISAAGALNLAVTKGAPFQWDDLAQVPYFTYAEAGTNRIVYFESAESARPKLDLVEKYGLGGIAIWRLGLEDPRLWTAVQEKLR